MTMHRFQCFSRSHVSQLRQLRFHLLHFDSLRTNIAQILKKHIKAKLSEMATYILGNVHPKQKSNRRSYYVHLTFISKQIIYFNTEISLKKNSDTLYTCHLSALNNCSR